MPSDGAMTAGAFPAACWLDGIPGGVTVGVVVGMRSEAALLPPDVAVGIAGADAGRAEAEARRLLAEGAQALLSFGVAGGLDPALAPGEIVVASAVRDGAVTFDANPVWMCRLLNAIPQSQSGLVLASAEALCHRRDKAARFAATGARVVDMESGAVARVAAAAGRPFAVIRAVADGADTTLPRSALAGIGADGQTRPLAVAARLAMRPWDLPALLRLGADSHAAHAALRSAARAVGPGFGL